MNHTPIANILKLGEPTKNITVRGWVRTFRANRFVALNDGSTIKNLQCVIDFENTPEETLTRITTGSSLELIGDIVESSGRGQTVEMTVREFTILGDSDPEAFPIQPKRHTMEFLRENAHLRIRTNTFGAVMRIRSKLAYAVHNHFQKQGYFYMHTPVIAGIDAEGAGEMFEVKATDSKEDFFGKPVNLTVSGQLEAETYALSLGKVYTFGPTFRAENSNTTRHLAEFWMIEPEIAFAELEDNMDIAEKFIKGVIQEVLDSCKDDLEFLDERLTKEQSQLPKEKREPMGLIEKLEFVVKDDFERVSYTEAVEILKNSKPNKNGKFQYPIDGWGVDIQTEHERYLVEKHFKKPVIMYDYPAAVKAFYMRLNDDGKTVRAMDILVPIIGELVGGSQREERLDVLEKKVKEFGVDEKELWWYMDLRKFGTVKHSGFGLGFERLVQFVTGMGNIRDVIPYPRAVGSVEF